MVGGYRFESVPDGIALQRHDDNRVEAYINHETSLVPFPVQGVSGAQTLHDFTNAMVSKLRIHQKSGGILHGAYVIPSEANFQRFCSNFIATAEHGFDRPMLLTNEEATNRVFGLGGPDVPDRGVFPARRHGGAAYPLARAGPPRPAACAV